MQESRGNDEKLIAIVECAQNMRKQIHKLSSIAYPKKAIFMKVDRRPIKRIKKQSARVMIPITIAVSVMQLFKIIMQPIPRFPKGGIVADNNKPEIINFNNETISVHPHVQPSRNDYRGV
jgi:hypothetical protein